MPLTYVDRSRYSTGLSHCMMARHLGYHAYGTGIHIVGTSIPLSTGSGVHKSVELIGGWAQQRQEAGKSVDEILEEIHNEIAEPAIQQAIEEYEKEIDEIGLKELVDSPEDIDEIVNEQSTLIGGLSWIWIEKALPWVLSNYQILAVEQEFSYLIKCTCGLGVEIACPPSQHESRGCNGIVLMTRPDLLLRNFQSGNLAYVEIKTGADVMKGNYAQQYEDNIQFALGAVAASKVLEEDITEMYVHALQKGKRQAEYDPITKSYSGPIKQQSSLCYGYFRAGQPPMLEEDIRPSYWNEDPVTGKRWGATESKGYQKLPVWRMPFEGLQPGTPHYSYYVREVLDSAEQEKFLKFIGPIDYPGFLIDRLLTEIVAEEERWIERTNYLNEVLESVGGNVADSEYQNALAVVISRSWSCHNYFGGSCEYTRICFQKEGWDDPLGEKQLSRAFYKKRSPNHPIELNSEMFQD